MSVEPLLIAALVESGNPKKALREGIDSDDFDEYFEEFEWLLFMAEQRREITQRQFLNKFKDFTWILPEEPIAALCAELKREKAYGDIQDLLKEMAEDLEPDNAFELANRVRDRLGMIVRNDNAQKNVYMTQDWRDYVKEMRHLRKLREMGEPPGLPTGLAHLDIHLGGFQRGTMGDVQARPGEGKSLLLARFCAVQKLNGRRAGLFSPEMNEKQHRDRMNTIYSSFKSVQEACGLKGAFRNMALRNGEVNEKRLAEFLEYMESLPGEVILFTNKTRKGKISPAYIESMIDEENLDLVIVDPIYKLRSPRRRESQYMETADCVDAVEDICKTHNIPVIISNQAHRQNSAKGRAPSKDQSFGTDLPIQESDWVINVKHWAEDKQMELRCDKNRHGEPFTLLCRCLPNVGILSEMTELTVDYTNGYDHEQADEAVRKELTENGKRARNRAGSSNGNGIRKPLPVGA